MVTSICIYRVTPEGTSDFRELLKQHWPTLRRLELATETPPTVYEGRDETERPIFVEVLKWKDSEGPNVAHELPEVMAIWESMGRLCEERSGRMAMEFPHVEEISIHG